MCVEKWSLKFGGPSLSWIVITLHWSSEIDHLEEFEWNISMLIWFGGSIYWLRQSEPEMFSFEISNWEICGCAAKLCRIFDLCNDHTGIEVPVKYFKMLPTRFSSMPNVIARYNFGFVLLLFFLCMEIGYWKLVVAWWQSLLGYFLDLPVWFGGGDALWNQWALEHEGERVSPVPCKALIFEEK